MNTKAKAFTDDAVSYDKDYLKVNLDLKLNENEKNILNFQGDKLEMRYRHFGNEYEDMKDVLVIPEDLSDGETEQYANVITDLFWNEQTGLIMYYDPFRFVSDRNPAGPNLQQSTSAKQGALSSNLNKNGKNSYRDLDLKQWIINMDYTRLKEPTSRNQTIYEHMIKAFELLSHPLKFEAINQNGNIMFKNEEDGKQLSVDMLSDGFKSIFSIVLDIIRRLALAPEDI